MIHAYNEHLELIETLSLANKCIHLQGKNLPDWIAIAEKISDRFATTLYEKKEDTSEGSFYRRCKLLPEMVGKTTFLQQLGKKLEGHLD